MGRSKVRGKILAFLSIEGEGTRYQIVKKIGLSNSRVYEGIKKLETEGFVKSEKTGDARTGLPIKTYTITPKGLIKFLCDQPVFLGRLDEIASKHGSSLPLLFGKLNHFTQTGVKEFIIDTLKENLGPEPKKPTTEPRFLSVLSAQGLWRFISEKEFAKRITNEILFSWLSSKASAKKERITWINALAADPELKSYAISCLKEKKKKYDEFAEFHEGAIEAIDQNRPELFEKIVKKLEGGEK